MGPHVWFFSAENACVTRKLVSVGVSEGCVILRLLGANRGLAESHESRMDTGYLRVFALWFLFFLIGAERGET